MINLPEEEVEEIKSAGQEALKNLRRLVGPGYQKWLENLTPEENKKISSQIIIEH